MRKWVQAIPVVTVISMALLAVPAVAQQPDLPDERSSQMSEQATPALTEAQKQEIAAIYKELFDKKRQLVAKYLEYGVITEEKAKLWSQRMDKHYAKLEQSGFVPQWKHCDKKKDKD